MFASDTGIMRVSANGGTPELAVQKKEDERLSNPSLVLDGRYMLFSRAQQDSTAAMQWDDAEIVLEDLATHERRNWCVGGPTGVWLAPHYLVYGRGTRFLPSPWTRHAANDRHAGETRRRSRPSLGGGTGSQQFSVSPSGTLAYVKGGADERQQLVWMSPGRSETAVTETGRVSLSAPVARGIADRLLRWARR